MLYAVSMNVRVFLYNSHLYPAFCLSLQRLPLEILHCVNVRGFPSCGEVLARSLSKIKFEVISGLVSALMLPPCTCGFYETLFHITVQLPLLRGVLLVASTLTFGDLGAHAGGTIESHGQR